MKRVALVYDRVNSQGGAERVLQALHTIYPDAPLFTSVFDAKGAPWAKGWDVRPSWLQHIPWLRRRHQVVGWLMPLVFESFDFSAFDLVISVTSESAKGIVTRPGQCHVCYLLTPTRYLWSHQDEYLESLPGVLRGVAKVIISFLRRWDRVAAFRPDVFIPISQRVADRAHQYYGRITTEPLYPALAELPPAKKPRQVPKQPFFLTWGRHVAYKRFADVIRASMAANVSLVVAGTGPETERLKRIVGGRAGIHFVGGISDAELAWYVNAAQAAIFLQEEDFGIVAIEALHQGCPVIINARSGAAELMKDGQDGVLLADATEQNLTKVLKTWDETQWKRLDIKRRARHYDVGHFVSAWNKQLASLPLQHDC